MDNAKTVSPASGADAGSVDPLELAWLCEDALELRDRVAAKRPHRRDELDTAMDRYREAARAWLLCDCEDEEAQEGPERAMEEAEQDMILVEWGRCRECGAQLGSADLDYIDVETCRQCVWDNHALHG